jgi:hypothetical protein
MKAADLTPYLPTLQVLGTAVITGAVALLSQRFSWRGKTKAERRALRADEQVRTLIEIQDMLNLMLDQHTMGKLERAFNELEELQEQPFSERFQRLRTQLQPQLVTMTKTQALMSRLANRSLANEGANIMHKLVKYKPNAETEDPELLEALSFFFSYQRKLGEEIAKQRDKG